MLVLLSGRTPAPPVQDGARPPRAEGEQEPVILLLLLRLMIIIIIMIRTMIRILILTLILILILILILQLIILLIIINKTKIINRKNKPGAAEITTESFRGNHLSNTTCLTRCFFKRDEQCSTVWCSLTRRNTQKNQHAQL